MKKARERHAHENLQRHLLVATLLADILDAGGALFGLDAVGGAAFAADCLDPGLALLDDERFLFHRFADQPLGLLAHRLFRHWPCPFMIRCGAVLSQPQHTS
jgi:hypothetical protein